MSKTERAANPTTEEAIKYLERMLFTQDFSPSTLRAKAVNTMAIEALREKAERSKGCEYCKTPFKTMLKFDLGIYGNGDTAELYVETDGQNIRAYDNDPRNPQIESSPINFCPICGRKLS
jgi:rRNA maturation endonuclease Nob1